MSTSLRARLQPISVSEPLPAGVPLMSTPGNGLDGSGFSPWRMIITSVPGAGAGAGGGPPGRVWGPVAHAATTVDAASAPPAAMALSRVRRPTACGGIWHITRIPFLLQRKCAASEPVRGGSPVRRELAIEGANPGGVGLTSRNGREAILAANHSVLPHRACGDDGGGAGASARPTLRSTPWALLVPVSARDDPGRGCALT